MTEAEILQRLKPGSWIGKPERQALEKMLAQTRAASPVRSNGECIAYAQNASPEATQRSEVDRGEVYGHISIIGSSAFVRASRAALDELRKTASWRWVSHLRCLRQEEDTISTHKNIAGYCDRGSKTFVVYPLAWSRRAKDYAALILHEAAHAAHEPTGDTTEDERIAMRIENQGRREMGFWFTFQPENNPTHHIQWEKDWNRKHAR